MKLTNQQIEYVENYIISKDIKYYELQIELTDHMVTSMEEFWKKDPELTFHQVKYYAEDKLKMVAEYFKFPKIILSILLAFLAFKASFYFDEPVNFVAKLFALLVILVTPALYSFYTNRKINGKRFLQLNISHSTFTGIFGLMYWILFPLNYFKDSVQSRPILILPFCCLWVLGILFLITGIHLQKKTIMNIKRQYQLT
jgi:hypothetical protein